MKIIDAATMFPLTFSGGLLRAAGQTRVTGSVTVSSPNGKVNAELRVAGEVLQYRVTTASFQTVR